MMGEYVFTRKNHDKSNTAYIKNLVAVLSYRPVRYPVKQKTLLWRIKLMPAAYLTTVTVYWRASRLIT